jgi:hypothetical protein
LTAGLAHTISRCKIVTFIYFLHLHYKSNNFIYNYEQFDKYFAKKLTNCNIYPIKRINNHPLYAHRLI